ncbi:MAG: flagellar hook assembly protein FlgD [Sphingomonas sp.]
MASSYETTLASLGIPTTTSAKTAAAAATNASPGTLGQADFLKLMTAQLQNQDPFSPVDNTQMVAQMAQFSSLSGISQMNTTLQAISDKLGATSTSDALAYVGHNVLTEGATAYPRTSGGIAGAVELDGAATGVKVSIQDANGQVLKTLSLGAQPQGTVNYDWDGTTDAGTAAGPGPYHVVVAAQEDGKTVASRGLVWAPVESVSMPSSGSPVLSVSGVGQIPTSAVRQIG